jgi:TIR domain
MPEVFINYAREDHYTAKRLYRDLRSEGIDAWIDSENLLPGSNWKSEIKQALRESRYALVLLSQHSTTKRGFVQKEIRDALEIMDEFPESEIFLIPVRLEECKPTHYQLSNLHWVDLFPSYDRGLATILRTLSRKQIIYAGNKQIVSLIQENNPIARLRGDTIKLPDGTISNPVTMIATRREWIYAMAKSLATGDISSFFEVVKQEKGTLIPSATLAEVIEWENYDELKLVRIKLLEGELAGYIVWTTSFFVP